MSRSGLVAFLLLYFTGRVAGQEAAVLSPTDPAWPDLVRLEAWGIASVGTSGAGPISVARVATILTQAHSRLEQDRLQAGPWHPDADSALARLGRRFGQKAAAGASGFLEASVGGGRSPGRIVPDNELGSLDLTLDPLWARSFGRAFPDRIGVATAVRAAVPLEEHVVLAGGVRYSGGRYSAEAPYRTGVTVESLYLRARLGPVAIQAGRDFLEGGGGPLTSLTLGSDAPPMNLVRIGTDRPVLLRFLGRSDVSLWVADTGPRQYYPHAKLFGLQLVSRPTERLAWVLTLMNKQLGQGAPSASLRQRLQDLTFVWSWFAAGDVNFSDKFVGLGIRVRTGRAVLEGQVVLTDFDPRRPEHSFKASAGYGFGVEFPTLGPTRRHDLRLDFSVTGPLVYRHQPFRSGWAVDRFPLGSALGPDARNVSLCWGYRPAAEGWTLGATVALDDRRGDLWTTSPTDSDKLVRVESLTDEIRFRALASAMRTLPGGGAGLALSGGLERVTGFAHEAGDVHWFTALKTRVWVAL